MKLIIAGSRNIVDYNKVMCIVVFLSKRFKPITEIVSGCAKGVDTLGEEIAEKVFNVPVKKFPANWNKYGKAAGPIRNRQMAEYADAAIIIHNGSKGSLDMIQQMQKLDKHIEVVII